jgi:hypothetical protein
MKRLLPLSAAFASTVLCTASAIVCVRSYVPARAAEWTRTTLTNQPTRRTLDTLFLRTHNGTLIAGRVTATGPVLNTPIPASNDAERAASQKYHHTLDERLATAHAALLLRHSRPDPDPFGCSIYWHTTQWPFPPGEHLHWRLAIPLWPLTALTFLLFLISIIRCFRGVSASTPSPLTIPPPPRRRDRLLARLTLLSLLLFLASAALWLRSYTGPQHGTRWYSSRASADTRSGTLHTTYLAAHHGQFILGHGTRPFPVLYLPDAHDVASFAPDVFQIERSYLDTVCFANPPLRSPAPFLYARQLPRTSSADHRWTIMAPAWFVTLVLAPVPLLQLRRLLRSRRSARQGHCPTCHYDLTGNLSGTCPECGTPIVHCT